MNRKKGKIKTLLKTQSRTARIPTPARNSIAEPIPKRGFKELMKDNPTVATILVICAIVGALASANQLYSNYKSAPNFNFHLANLLMGYRLNSQNKPIENSTVITLSGTVSNTGDKPFMPAFFSAKLKYGENEIPFLLEPRDETTLTLAVTDSGKFITGLNGNNLQNLKIVEPAVPELGNLYFSVPVDPKRLIMISKNTIAYIELCCTDAQDERHYVDIPFHPHRGHVSNYSKYGIKEVTASEYKKKLDTLIRFRKKPADL